MAARKPAFGRILDDEAVRDLHSPLYRAMRESFGQMQAAFAEKRPNWPLLIERIAALGITDGAGNPPKLRTAQATWYRVKRDMEKQGSGVCHIPAPQSARVPLIPPEPETDEASRPRRRSWNSAPR